jgi:hypothetical protein
MPSLPHLGYTPGSINLSRNNLELVAGFVKQQNPQSARRNNFPGEPVIPAYRLASSAFDINGMLKERFDPPW